MRSSTTWPRRTDTSAARTAVVPMSSPTTFRATLLSPLLCLGSGAWRPGHEASAVKVIDPPKCDLEKVAGRVASGA
jgi:hypothetical protein